MGKEEPTRVLRIVAKRNGFRRAGRAWSTEPRDVALDALSAEELAQLRAEPMLIVTEVEIAPPAGSQPAGERDGGTGAAEGAASLAPGASGTGAETTPAAKKRKKATTPRVGSRRSPRCVAGM